MLNVGWGEMGFIMIIALVVFGPNRLPEIARSAGKFIRQFQRETSRAMSDLKEGVGPLNMGIFDEPDAGTATDPIGAGAVEPVADAPATKQLTTTRRKTSAPPKRRAATTTRTGKASVAKKSAKRPATKRPAGRTAAARKPRRRA